MEDSLDMTKFPEGFNEALKALDFLPDDPEVRKGFMIGLINTIVISFL